MQCEGDTRFTYSANSETKGILNSPCLEVQRLPHVSDVDQPVAVLLVEPVADGGEVGGVVGVAAVRLDDRHRDLAAGPEHHLPALVLLQETFVVREI